jgi:retron-type reverse transcriptase
MFIDKVSGRKIEYGTKIVSFDIVNLFNTTPVDTALQVTREKLQEDIILHERTAHSVDTVMEMISTCVHNTYFQFEGTFYKQTSGMAMGSPLSPILCNIYMEYLEYKAISNFDPNFLLFLRYVDDFYSEWPDNMCPVEIFLHHLKFRCADTKFTIEIEKE